MCVRVCALQFVCNVSFAKIRKYYFGDLKHLKQKTALHTKKQTFWAYFKTIFELTTLITYCGFSKGGMRITNCVWESLVKR